jgi:Nif-specific regulatory protein
MHVKGECVGVLKLLTKTTEGCSNQEDLEWLEIFSTQASLTLQNARNYQKVRDEMDLLRDKVSGGEGYHTFIGKVKRFERRLSWQNGSLLRTPRY